MNQKNKAEILEYINTILSLRCWHDTGSLIPLDENIQNKSVDLYDYFDDSSTYMRMKENDIFSLLIDTLDIYSDSLEDDWLPNSIIELPIPKAYLFLKEIKNIILTSEDKDIEDNLINARNKLLDDA